MNEEEARRQKAEQGAEGTAYASTMQALRLAERSLPDFTSSYDGEIRRLYQSIISREPFRYDALSDPLYEQFRDRTVREGQLAMRDTMGQAAQLTGGYGSSYGQAVGQQQYGMYLQKLQDAMPEFYQTAYQRWKDEGDAVQAKLSAAKGLAGEEYGRWRDRQSSAAALEQKGYERTRDAYQDLAAAISGSGYVPEDGELKRSGMTRARAEALRTEYLRSKGLLHTGGGSSGGGGVWAGSIRYTGSKADTAGSKEQTKLAANQKGSSTQDKHRRNG